MATDSFTDKAQPISAAADAPASTGNHYLGMESVTPIVELADRHSNDLDVALFWAPRSGRRWVLGVHQAA
jgi:hypothetical protein